jgi:hypothetical protein
VATKPEGDNRWGLILARSFSPSQWWEQDWDREDSTLEVRAMWIYRRSETNLWTVGFYSPDGKWNSESDHETKDSAAKRVHWLNGGQN